tara:strand:+ start:28 stop:2490 length:2463 start_codon:yes stop_codon:yes gene_type:complete
MSISHRTNRLKLNGTPSVEKLQNGRYKLTVECTTMNSREDWYSANKARLFPDFGSLQSAEMSIDGLAPRTGEAYTDMRLTDVKAGNRSTVNGKAEYNVILTYETLGATFVKVKDDDISESENGLRKVKRIIIAEAGTDYVDESTPPVLKQVGITTITSQIDTETAITCTLASYEIFDTDSYREVNELYMQAGTLSETKDKVGSELSIVKETFASTPAAITDYSIANEQESNVDGIPTKRFTFLKDDVKLSDSEDNVGSQNAITEQWFNPSLVDAPSADPVTVDRRLKSGYSLAQENISDVEGIATRSFTFLKNNVVLSVSEDRVGSQLAITNEVFKPSNDAFAGKNVSGVALSGYSEASREKSKFEGIPTLRYTFLKDDVKLSESEDEVGSQNSITEEWFKPAATRNVKTNYELARTDASDVEGIPTERYTFLKPSIISLRQDFSNGLKKVSIQAFGMTAAEVTSELTEVTADHLLVSQTESDYEGIKTSTFEYQIDESFVTDFELNGLKQLTLIELSLSAFTSQTVGSLSATGVTLGLRLGSQETDNGGTIKVRESLWYEDGVLSQQRRSESDGVYRSTTTFLGEIPSTGTPIVGPIISKTEDNVGGLKTITVSTLQNADGGSLVAATGGAQPVASHSILSEFSYPGVVTISQLTLSGTGSTYTFVARDFSLQPPAVSKVPATLKVSFLPTSAPAYTSTDGLWNPTTWAQGSSRGIGWNYLPFSISRGFRGYRIDGIASDAANTVSGVGTTVQFDMISGRRIFGNTTWKIQVNGGPPDPVGGVYTLDYEVSLAFEDINGTAYYKHREIVSDAIPVQAGQ